MKEIIAGCCQFHVQPALVDANLATAERAIADLSARGCRLGVLPEMWPCGFPYPNLLEMARTSPDVLEQLAGMAARFGMVIVGSLPEEEGGTVFNTSYVLDSTGEIAGKYRKAHLFSLYREHLHFGRGDAPLLCETSAGKLGVMICYDLRFPELARRLAVDGAQILCVSALWPLARIDHWSLLLRTRAVENQLFTIGCNGCGTDDRITWGGCSMAASPFGAVLAQAGPEEETITAALNFDEIDSFRKLIPCFEDRAPEVYSAPYKKD
jgi:omega-amidase